eukprot:gnl/TRDRNA2_/TRDRNA2_69019_c0_seq1.p1 gnl/TRDRNA2_/TRDRNA2_69019_c0~~gnl/TRDRNA2_/TRDRNA2_69019_c0_seq1.p1  ORF type:complete len:318 (+),score=56.60 gnl/TRDRNA2_/TRDRNA2_69019_c0_seq1:74-1027(+)
MATIGAAGTAHPSLSPLDVECVYLKHGIMPDGMAYVSLHASAATATSEMVNEAAVWLDDFVQLQTSQKGFVAICDLRKASRPSGKICQQMAALAADGRRRSVFKKAMKECRIVLREGTPWDPTPWVIKGLLASCYTPICRTLLVTHPEQTEEEAFVLPMKATPTQQPDEEETVVLPMEATPTQQPEEESCSHPDSDSDYASDCETCYYSCEESDSESDDQQERASIASSSYSSVYLRNFAAPSDPMTAAHTAASDEVRHAKKGECDMDWSALEEAAAWSRVKVAFSLGSDALEDNSLFDSLGREGRVANLVRELCTW